MRIHPLVLAVSLLLVAGCQTAGVPAQRQGAQRRGTAPPVSLITERPVQVDPLPDEPPVTIATLETPDPSQPSEPSGPLSLQTRPDALRREEARAFTALPPMLKTVMDHMPERLSSPALMQLATTTLTADDWPAGTEARRLEQLLTWGQLEAAQQMLAVTIDPLLREDLAPLAVETAFLLGQDEQACLDVRAKLGQFSGPFWSKALMTCQIMAGEMRKAQLGVQILRERFPTERVFADAIESILLGTQVRLPETALGLVLLEATGWSVTRSLPLPLPAKVLAAMPYRLTADQPGAGAVFERAYGAGVMTPGQLTTVLSSVSLAPQDLANPLAAVENATPLRALAVLDQAGATASPLIQAELIAAALKKTPLTGAGGAFLAQRITDRLTPSPELRWFAVRAATLLRLHGNPGNPVNPEAARQWQDLLRDNAPTDDAFWPVLTYLDGKADEAALVDWAARQVRRNRATAPAVMARVFSLLRQRGIAVPAELWLKAADFDERYRVRLPSTGLLELLAQQATEKQQLETALLVLVTLAPERLDRTHGSILLHALSALSHTGLEQQAQQLGSEILTLEVQ